MTYMLSRKGTYNQKATYWAQQKHDGFGGETWVAPVVVSCRWESATEETLSVAYKVSGETVVSQAIVFTKTPLVVGGYLYLGETTDENPARITGAFIIRSVTTIPALRGTKAEYTAHL